MSADAPDDDVAKKFVQLVERQGWSESLKGAVGISLLKATGLKIFTSQESEIGRPANMPAPPGARTATSAAAHLGLPFAHSITGDPAFRTPGILETNSIMKMLFLIYKDAHGALGQEAFASRVARMWAPMKSRLHHDNREILVMSYKACVLQAVREGNDADADPLSSSAIFPEAREVFRRMSNTTMAAMGNKALQRSIAPARHGLPMGVTSPSDPPPLRQSEAFNCAPTSYFHLVLRPLSRIMVAHLQLEMKTLVEKRRAEATHDDHEDSEDDIDPVGFNACRELLSMLDAWAKPPTGGGNKGNDKVFPRRLFELVEKWAVDSLGEVPDVADIKDASDAKRYLKPYLSQPSGQGNATSGGSEGISGNGSEGGGGVDEMPNEGGSGYETPNVAHRDDSSSDHTQYSPCG